MLFHTWTEKYSYFQLTIFGLVCVMCNKGLFKNKVSDWVACHVATKKGFIFDHLLCKIWSHCVFCLLFIISILKSGCPNYKHIKGGGFTKLWTNKILPQKNLHPCMNENTLYMFRRQYWLLTHCTINLRWTFA